MDEPNLTENDRLAIRLPVSGKRHIQLSEYLGSRGDILEAVNKKGWWLTEHLDSEALILVTKEDFRADYKIVSPRYPFSGMRYAMNVSGMGFWVRQLIHILTPFYVFTLYSRRIFKSFSRKDT